MRSLILSVLVILFASNLNAQHKRPGKNNHFETGLYRGYALYYGDLADRGAYLNMKDKGSAYGFYLRKNFNEYTALKLSYTTGIIQGSDADSDVDSIINRNLSFVNTIHEFSLMTEINFFPFDICKSTATYAPYVYFGFSIYTHNPQAIINGDYVDLLPLRTEGQNTFPYNGPAGRLWDDGGRGGYRGEYYLLQAAIPVGLGFKYRFYRNSTIAFELGYRLIFTDYIDDVSKTYVANPIGANDDPNSARLADRATELPNGVRHQEGQARGTIKGNDYFVFMGITFSFSTAKCGKRNPIQCFNFNKWS